MSNYPSFIAVGLAVSVLLFQLVSGFEGEAYDMRQKRKTASWHHRGIILNNDGNDLRTSKFEGAPSHEIFLSKRTTDLADSQVGSIFYCDGVFNMYTHRSSGVTEVRKFRGNGDQAFEWELALSGKDPLETIIDFGSKNGIEVFWSFRVNDTHDVEAGPLFSHWKEENPALLMGPRPYGDWRSAFPYGGSRWSSVDYSHSAVREKAFQIIQDVCLRYNVDGIELDFFRTPVLFRPQMNGEPVTQYHSDLFTELMVEIRNMTLAVAAKRGRPLLIAIRVPDSVDYCRAIGIDLKKWLANDLIDILIGADHFLLEPWERLVGLGGKYGVPVYACLSDMRLEGRATRDQDYYPDYGDVRQGDLYNIDIWRSEAVLAWEAGVHGIYIFNRFNPRDPIFQEIGSPKTILRENLDPLYNLIQIKPGGHGRPEYWLKNGLDYLKCISIEPQMPIISEERLVTLAFPEAAARIHYTQDGASPNLEAPIYQKPIKLDHSTIIRARAYFPDGNPASAVMNRHFKWASKGVTLSGTKLPSSIQSYKPKLVWQGDIDSKDDAAGAWLWIVSESLDEGEAILRINKTYTPSWPASMVNLRNPAPVGSVIFIPQSVLMVGKNEIEIQYLGDVSWGRSGIIVNEIALYLE